MPAFSGAFSGQGGADRAPGGGAGGDALGPVPPGGGGRGVRGPAEHPPPCLGGAGRRGARGVRGPGGERGPPAPGGGGQRGGPARGSLVMNPSFQGVEAEKALEAPGSWRGCLDLPS